MANATTTPTTPPPPPAATAGTPSYSSSGQQAAGAGDTTSFPAFDSSLSQVSWDNTPGPSKTFTAQNPNFQALGALLAILKNLEQGVPLSEGTDATVLSEVLKDAGVGAGAAQAPQSVKTGEVGQLANDIASGIRTLAPGNTKGVAAGNKYPEERVGRTGAAGEEVASSLVLNSPEYRKIENTVQTAIEKHLTQAGVPTDTLGAHPTSDQIEQLDISPITKQRLEAEGYDLASVNSLGTLVETLQSSPPKPQTEAGAKGTMTAQDYYQSFQQQWNNPAYQTEISGQLAQAGLLDTASPTKAQAGAAYQQMLTLAAQAKQPPEAYLTAAQKGTQAGIGAELPANDEYVESIGNQFGVHLSRAQINALSAANPDASTQPGSSDTGLRAQIAGLYLQNYDPKQGPTGYASVISAAVDQYAGAYAVPMTDSAKQALIQKVLLAGNFTSSYEANLQGTTAAENYMKQQASTLYPAYSSQISQGMTMKDIAAPYLQSAQDTLGVNASALSLTDPKWAKVLDGNADGSPVSLADWRSHLMTDPQYGWTSTQPARDIGADISSALGQEFGLAGQGQNPTSAATQSQT